MSNAQLELFVRPVSDTELSLDIRILSSGIESIPKAVDASATSVGAVAAAATPEEPAAAPAAAAPTEEPVADAPARPRLQLAKRSKPVDEKTWEVRDMGAGGNQWGGLNVDAKRKKKRCVECTRPLAEESTSLVCDRCAGTAPPPEVTASPPSKSAPDKSPLSNAALPPGSLPPGTLLPTKASPAASASVSPMGSAKASPALSYAAAAKPPSAPLAASPPAPPSAAPEDDTLDDWEQIEVRRHPRQMRPLPRPCTFRQRPPLPIRLLFHSSACIQHHTPLPPHARPGFRDLGASHHTPLVMRLRRTVFLSSRRAAPRRPTARASC